jgi:hypothetical protein
MVNKIKIGYFLEDRGHEILLKAFVHRLAVEKGFSPEDWKDDVRAARGGKSIGAFKKFGYNSAAMSMVKKSFGKWTSTQQRKTIHH